MHEQMKQLASELKADATREAREDLQRYLDSQAENVREEQAALDADERLDRELKTYPINPSARMQAEEAVINEALARLQRERIARIQR